MSEPTSPIQVHVPQENVNDDSVTINRWLIKDGQKVEKDQPLVEVETSKADFEIPSPATGYVKHLAAEGSDVPVGAAICLIGETLESLKSTPSATPAEPASAPTPTPAAIAHIAVAAESNGSHAHVCRTALHNVATRFSQNAKRLVQQHGLNEASFKGRGLICENNVLDFMGKKPQPAATEKTPAASCDRTPARSSPQPSIGVPVKIEKTPRSKQMEIRYLRSAHDNVIPSTVSVSARHFPRALHNDEPSTLPAAIIFEAARLLRKYPQFNAFHAEGHGHFYQDINIGFAVDLGEGLRVPVIRNADTKTLPQLVEEQRELVVQSIAGELRPEALSGGTFTVTDLSGEGVTSFVPLINQGQSAIIGVGAVDPARGLNTYQLIMTFDHQLSEGRAAAKFLLDLRDRLEAHEQNLAAKDLAAAGITDIACYRCSIAAKDLPPGHFMLMGYPRNSTTPQPICTVCVQDY